MPGSGIEARMTACQEDVLTTTLTLASSRNPVRFGVSFSVLLCVHTPADNLISPNPIILTSQWLWVHEDYSLFLPWTECML